MLAWGFDRHIKVIKRKDLIVCMYIMNTLIITTCYKIANIHRTLLLVVGITITDRH